MASGLHWVPVSGSFSHPPTQRPLPMDHLLDRMKATPQVGQPRSQSSRVLALGVPMGLFQVTESIPVFRQQIPLWAGTVAQVLVTRLTRMWLGFLSILCLFSPGFTISFHSCLWVTFIGPFCLCFTVRFSSFFPFLSTFSTCLFLSFVLVALLPLGWQLSVPLLTQNHLPWWTKQVSGC